MSYPTSIIDSTAWDPSPNFDSLANHEIEGILGPWLMGQTAFPNSFTHPTTSNGANALDADALELRTLLELQETRQKEIELLRQLLQIRAGRQATQLVRADADSHRNRGLDPTQKLVQSLAHQMILPGVGNVATNGSLPPIPSDGAIPNSVCGDSGQAPPLEFPPFVEHPSNLSDSTIESADDSNFAHYSYEPASEDQGIRSDRNCSLISNLAFPPITDNEGEASTTVFLVNQAETAADHTATDHTATSSSESPTAQIPVPSSESVIVRSKRRHSVLEIPGVDCFPSNEQTSNFPREKRPCTYEERENIKAVKKVGGACLNCRDGKRRVSHSICYNNYMY